MMTCQICGNQDGPFQFEQVDGPFRIPAKDVGDNAILLICEDCWDRLKKVRKKYDTANLCNKGHARRVSRTYGRSK